MWIYPIQYDVIVIGGGHAGCEASLAAARRGCRTLLLTMNLDTIAKMSCNPAIGGVAKGHMVREIDALGGEMGRCIDATAIQCRMLNRSKGPAVWAPRAQADKVAYQFSMKQRLELQERLELKQGSVEELLVEGDRIRGVTTKEGVHYRSTCVIISSGTFMRGLMHIGAEQLSGGRAGCQAAVGLSGTLQRLGFTLGRLKTGTPPRIHRRSIDFSQCEEQHGEEGISFSFDPLPEKRLPQLSCWIAYTNPDTHRVIQSQLHRSPLYSGKIQSVGPRYCPSIEDKVVRFADKQRHQIFLEPEGVQTEEFYANGISTSLPLEVQLDFLRTIPALRNAEVTRPAYAIEYDYVTSGQIRETLESRNVEGLFLAGQVNGTTGYEEAAAQGLIAGVNAASRALHLPPFLLGRSEAYIGVMIDDLITKPLSEPYRMFTSRAEHRLLLRQDNADLRLRDHGYQLGLIDADRYARFTHKKQTIEAEIVRLETTFKHVGDRGYSLMQLLARPENSYQSLLENHPDAVVDYDDEISLQIELHAKYAGYIKRQQQEVERLAHAESIAIPDSFDFSTIQGLRHEAEQALVKQHPSNLGQAARISGVSPADISVLMIALKAKSSI